MTNLDLILESIENKAIEEKEKILDKARKEVAEIEAEAKKKQEAEEEKILKDARDDASLLIENERLRTSRKARDIKIAGKNKLIDEVLDKLLENLKNLDRPAYKKFVINRLKDFPKSDGEILLQEGMDYSFDSDDLKGMRVSAETVEDGFIIRDGDISYDNRFESIIDYERDELKKLISEKLFTRDEA